MSASAENKSNGNKVSTKTDQIGKGMIAGSREPFRVVDKNIMKEKENVRKEDTYKKSSEVPPRPNNTYNLRNNLIRKRNQESQDYENFKNLSKEKRMKLLAKNENKSVINAKTNPAALNENVVQASHNKDRWQNVTVNKPTLRSLPNLSLELFKDVVNIDENDASLFLVTEYVNDIYNYLFLLENKFNLKPNYMEGYKEISPEMRSILLDWIADIQVQSHFTLETFQLTITLIDLYLQKVSDVKRRELQLVGVVALFIAIKYEELDPPTIDDMAFITDNTYTNADIRQMEMQFLKKIDFNLAKPLPIYFLRRFAKAGSLKPHEYNGAKYFCDLALLNYDMVHFKGSKLAAASVFLALNLFGRCSKNSIGIQNCLWTPTLIFYSRYRANDLHSLVKSMAILVRDAPNSKHQALYKKYSSSNFSSISKRAELKGSSFDSFILSIN